MVQVKKDRPSIDKLSRSPEMIEAVGQIGILPSPTDERLVKTVHGDEIVPPYT
jgi:hypothetical protein